MGKVKDGSPAAKSAKVAKGGPAGDSKGRFAPFLANLSGQPLQAAPGPAGPALDRDRPGLIIVFGLRELYDSLDGRRPRRPRFGVPAADRRWSSAWLIFRLAPVPAVRRVPDRHRSRDEQGLVDQPRRPEAGDDRRPGDGRPDGRLPLRRRLALVQPAPARSASSGSATRQRPGLERLSAARSLVARTGSIRPIRPPHRDGLA